MASLISLKLTNNAPQREKSESSDTQLNQENRPSHTPYEQQTGEPSPELLVEVDGKDSHGDGVTSSGAESGPQLSVRRYRGQCLQPGRAVRLIKLTTYVLLTCAYFVYFTLALVRR
ncbi:hypothetical protein BaRGS_00034249 [Batillaria attramentaria]|uniref:Uncharacterized protein n=1 Tax=Batillaria attramentaria TaxID=370345 RepID=A0ABD0JIE0_9CAEN